ncbi:hypothetical protein M0812_26787 [Anaeramoeba flamelloides]|uniref:Uncharacterized protein n=1 Tax=Anaeramoeba flamelloides TaxID=1746091 RepID=A0AAV7YF31_9EUKA|nr:hypothetical protein M0812_26787 [Anaeramoeba flamelloides]
MNNPQPLNSSKVVVGPFEYGKSTLLDILSSYSQKSIHQSSFTFYVPVEELKFDHVTIQKRWIWNGDEFEYSPHSDVVAILLHSSRYVPPKNSKIVHKSIIRYNTINNRSVEEQYGTKKLELVGVLASFRFLDKEVNKFSMKRKNGIRSRYSTKVVRPIVYAEEVQIVPTKNEIPTNFVFPKNEHPSSKKNPVFSKHKFVKNNSSTSNKQKNKRLNKNEKKNENEKEITKKKSKKINNQKKKKEIKANPNYNTKRNSNTNTNLGIDPDSRTQAIGNTTTGTNKSNNGNNNLDNKTLLQSSPKFQVNNAQLSQNQNQNQNKSQSQSQNQNQNINPNFNLYTNFNKQNVNNQIPNQTIGLNSSLNNQNNFNFINQPFNENFLFNPLLYLNDLQSNRQQEKPKFSSQFNRLPKNFQIPNSLNEFDRKRNNFNPPLIQNQVHPNYTINQSQQQQSHNLQSNYFSNQQHNQLEEKKMQIPTILQNQKNEGLFQLGNLSENIIKNYSNTNNNNNTNNNTDTSLGKNSTEPEFETEKFFNHKTNPKRKLNNTIGMLKNDPEILNITTNPINDFMVTRNDNHYNLLSDKNTIDKRNTLHLTKINKIERKLTTPNTNQAETTLSNETIGFSLSNDPCLAYSSDIILQQGISDPNKSLETFSRIVLYLETQSKRYEFSLKDNQMFRLSEVLKPHTYPKRRLLNTKNVPMQKKLIIILKENLKFDQIKWCSNWVLFDDILVTATKFFSCNRIIPLKFENID